MGNHPIVVHMLPVVGPYIDYRADLAAGRFGWAAIDAAFIALDAILLGLDFATVGAATPGTLAATAARITMRNAVKARGMADITRAGVRALSVEAEASRAGAKAAEFGKRSVGAAERVWTKSARMNAAQLPHRGGKVRYVPPKNWPASEPLPRGPNSGYMVGNEWTKGPSRTQGEAFEWDVQLPGGGHWNVSLQGHITH